MLLEVLDGTARDIIGTNVRTICLPTYTGSVVGQILVLQSL